MNATAEWTLRMLGNETLWQAAGAASTALSAANVPFAVIGGVAVCLHGYRRNTVDVDLLVRNEDSASIKEALTAAAFDWSRAEKEFRSPSGIPIQFVLAGEREGKGLNIGFPDPASATVEIEGLPVLTLVHLIQSKIACGLGDSRRTHKDFADVVELIIVNKLGSDYERFLDKAVRKEFRLLVKRSRGEESIAVEQASSLLIPQLFQRRRCFTPQAN